MKLTAKDIVSIVHSGEGTKSYSRNPLVFGLFNRINMVEQVGSGIGRIEKELKNAGLPKPVYKTEGLFTVVFQRTTQKTSEKTTQKTSEKIMILVAKHPEITILDMSKYIGVTERSIERNIKRLKEQGVLKRIGSDKKGLWQIIEEDK